MALKRTWRWLALSILATPVFIGLFVAGRLLVYSYARPDEDVTTGALRIMSYHRVGCADVTRAFRGWGDDMSGYGEGTITAQCEDGTRYVLTAQPLCSETKLCRWFSLHCWDVEKEHPRRS